MDIAQDMMTDRVKSIGNTIVNMVLARVTEEIKLSWYYKDNLKKLEETLIMMNAILRNSAGATSNEAVKLWLLKLENIVSDAENMLDVLAFEKVRQKLVKKLSFSKRLHSLFSSSNPVLVQSKMGHWVRRIDSSIRKAYKEADDLGLRPADLPSHPAGTNANGERAVTGDSNVLQETRDTPDTSFVVGRADEKAAIMKHVLCNKASAHLPVVAIVGLGGLGKTVLAQEVFEDEEVIGHFSERIWITVSRELTIKKILNGMMGFIKKSKFDCDSVELTVQTLKESLSGKTYLLVLDDLWDTDDQFIWDSLLNALRRISGSECSMILVTTRDEGVAKRMDTSLIHEVRPLSEDDSWTLFKRYAFANRPQEISLEEFGKRIVDKCRGVPLAIKTIGMLVAKKTAREWEIIENNKLWDAPQDKAGILPSLMLSYTYLPSPCVKKCFSFLSIYPKATGFLKQYLICMWMANGFLQQPSDGNLTIEDIGDGYISTLLSISFLQEHQRNELGEIIKFTMHDLVHDLATYVGKHECLSLDSNAGDARGHNVEKVKHLYLPEGHSGNCDALVLRNLCSLGIVGSLPKGILSHVKYLRSLELIFMDLEEVPKSIAGLKCLKFLDLSGNLIEVLPDWIMALYNLQTLYLWDCPNLIRIPEGLGNLVNLRHFAVGNRLIQLPTGVEQLRCVQSLPPLMVQDGGFQISELKDLHDLCGLLEISGLELIKSKQDAEKANLSEKSRVEQLFLVWKTGSSEDHSNHLHEEVLEGLYPNSNVRLLCLEGYRGKKFPLWVMTMDVSRDVNCQSQRLLCNLTNIDLSNCPRCEELPTMGHLPCLKFLKISKMDNLKQIGRKLYCCDDQKSITETSCDLSGFMKPQMVCFPKLEELRLNDLDNLVEWCELEPQVVCFPQLELLEITFCAQLKTTPNKFPSLKKFSAKGITSGVPVSNIIINNTTLNALEIEEVEELENLPEELSQCASLQTLTISNCPKLTSLPDVSGLTSLREVSISCNDSLRNPPSGLKSCTSLEILEFYKCHKSRAITEDLSGLGLLSMLRISGQTEMITEPPNWLLNGLPRLKFLEIGTYEELDHFPDISPLLNITSLVKLYLGGWPMLQSRTLPDQLQRFTRLTQLLIDRFDELEKLPEGLGSLSSLEDLILYDCPKLMWLPSMYAMKRLTKFCYFKIRRCPLLEENVKVHGLEYDKVAYVEVDLD